MINILNSNLKSLTSAIIILLIGTTIQAQDSAFLQGKVWNDVNMNGTIDANEAGVEGVSISLFVGGFEIEDFNTNIDGDYSRSLITDIDFSIMVEVPENYTNTTATSYDFTTATNGTYTFNFGIVLDNGTSCQDFGATDITITSSHCGAMNDGALEFNLNGTAPYSVSFNDGDVLTFDSDQISLVDLAPGTMSIVASDAIDCSTLFSSLIPEIGSPEFSYEIEEQLCDSSLVVFSVSAPLDEPITFEINNNTITVESAPDSFTLLLASGDYSAVAESMGCVTIKSIVVPSLEASNYTLSSSNTSDCEIEDGSISIEIEDTLNMNWSVNGTLMESNTLENLAEGTYEVVVTNTICNNSSTETISILLPEDCYGTENQPPCADTLSICTGPMQGFDICIEQCDPDGDPTTITNHSGSLFGCSIYLLNDTCFRYTPLPAFLGADYLELTVCDDQDPPACSTWAYNIFVGECGPLAVNDETTTFVNVPVSVDVIVNDSHPEGLDFYISQTTDGLFGTTEIIDGEVVYTPNQDYVGGDSFNYTICDENDNCTEAIVLVTVLETSDECFAEAGIFQLPLDSCFSGTVFSTINVFNAINEPGYGYYYVLANDTTGSLGVCQILSISESPSFNMTGLDYEHYKIFGFSTNFDLINYNGIDDIFTVEQLNQVLAENEECFDFAENKIVFSYEETCECLAEAGAFILPEDSCFSDAVYTSIDVFGATTEPGFNYYYVLANDTTGSLGVCQILSISESPSFIMEGLDYAHYKIFGFSTNFDLINYNGIEDIFTVEQLNQVLGENEECFDFADNKIEFDYAASCEEPYICTDTTYYCAENGVALDICLDFCDISGTGAVIDTVFSTYTFCSVNVIGDTCVNYTALPGQIGMDSIITIACNPLNICDTVITYLMIGCPQPSAMDDFYSIDDNSSNFFNVLANDSDPCGRPLTLSVLADPLNGSVVATENGYTYMPTPGFNGEDTFQYIACNNCSEAACDTALVTILIGTDEEMIMDLQPDIVHTPMDVMITIDVLNNDEGNNLTIFGTSQAVNGTVDLIGTQVLYTPNEGYVGQDYFYYTACDENLNCQTTYVQIDVFNESLNLPPVGGNDIITLLNNNGVGYVLINDMDPENDTLTITTILDAPDCADISINEDGSALQINNAEDCEGIFTFQYVVCDNADPALCDTVDVASGIGMLNHSPIAENDTIPASPNEPVLFNLEASDIDNDNVFYSLGSGPECGVVEVDPSGLVLYQAGEDCAQDVLMFIACDDGTPELCDTGYVLINVLEDPAPVVDAAVDIAQTPMDSAIVICVMENDFGENITVQNNFTSTENGTLSFNAENNCFTYTPNEGYTGSEYFLYTICDDNIPSNCDQTLVAITVFNGENQPPYANNDQASGEVNETLNIQVLNNDSDPEGEFLNISGLENVPDGITVTILNDGAGPIAVVNNTGSTGEFFFDYIVCDPGQECATATVAIAFGIEHSNQPPNADNIYVSMLENSIDILCLLSGDYISDPDGDAVVYFLASEPQNGSTEINDDGCVEYTPDEDFIGTDYFTYVACDNGTPELCDSAFVQIIVESTDTGLVVIANDDIATTNVNEPVDVTIFDNDIISPELPFSTNIIIQPISGTAVLLNSGTEDVSIYYTPDDGYVGTDSLQYQLCVGSVCDTAWVYFTVELVDCVLNIPNGISPNGDDIMDAFYIEDVSSCYNDREIRIFNRWGNEVWSVIDFTEADQWNGTWENNDEAVAEGTYFYMIKMIRNETGELIEKAGTVEVFR